MWGEGGIPENGKNPRNSRILPLETGWQAGSRSVRLVGVAMPVKTPRISMLSVRPLAVGRGFCFATDMIMVEGCRVGFMYRERPEGSLDSGWRFTAGIESRDYIVSPANLGMYDLNTVANVDPAVVPLLDAPPGSVFERDEGGLFVPVEEEEEVR